MTEEKTPMATEANKPSQDPPTQIPEKSNLSLLLVAFLVLFGIAFLVGIGLLFYYFLAPSPPSPCSNRNPNGTCDPDYTCTSTPSGNYICLQECSLESFCPDGTLCTTVDDKNVCYPV